jgi:predicted metal-binding protein
VRRASRQTVPVPRPCATTVLLCRGCCCGTRKKHPGVDHEAQEDALRAAADGHPDVELRVVDCLDECDRSNVVVVRRAGRPAKDRDAWLGGMLTGKASTALASWLAEGAADPMPGPLVGHRFRHLPPRRSRRSS